MTGRLIAVVGPSGAGKDTLIAEARKRRPDILFVRRQITRSGDAGGADFEPVSAVSFATRLAAGAYAFHWHAHGLDYGMQASIETALAQGRTVVFNGARAALAAAHARHPGVEVVPVTAPPAVLAARLARRGRQKKAEIAKRLARAGDTTPDGAVVIDNGGQLKPAVKAFLADLDRAAEIA